VFSSDLSKQSSLPSQNSILKIHLIPSSHFVIPLPHGFTNNINHIQEEVYTYFIDIAIRLTRRMPLVEQKLPTLPEHLSSPPVFSGVRVSRSLVLCVCYVDRYLSFCAFSFDHCVVCSSSIYWFWLPLWYLQTRLNKFTRIRVFIARSVDFASFYDFAIGFCNHSDTQTVWYVFVFDLNLNCLPFQSTWVHSRF
jgi:hypothetical protein